jgi:hypothetical protein
MNCIRAVSATNKKIKVLSPFLVGLCLFFLSTSSAEAQLSEQPPGQPNGYKHFHTPNTEIHKDRPVSAFHSRLTTKHSPNQFNTILQYPLSTIKAEKATAPGPTVSVVKFPYSAYSYHDLGLFCKWEVNMEKAAKIPVKFRLGEVQYVERLEGKLPYLPQ